MQVVLLNSNNQVFETRQGFLNCKFHIYEKITATQFNKDEIIKESIIINDIINNGFFLSNFDGAKLQFFIKSYREENYRILENPKQGNSQIEITTPNKDLTITSAVNNKIKISLADFSSNTQIAILIEYF